MDIAIRVTSLAKPGFAGKPDLTHSVKICCPVVARDLGINFLQNLTKAKLISIIKQIPFRAMPGSKVVCWDLVKDTDSLSSNSSPQ